MIVPSSRLLFWVGFVVLPFALLGALLPGALGIALVAIVALAVAAVLDAALASRQLAGLGARVGPVTRLTQDKPGVIALQLVNSTQQPMRLRVGLPLPVELESKETSIAAQLPAGSTLSKLDWPVEPTRRGQFPLSSCHIERPSRLGLWLARRRVELKGEIRVYPNLLPECKNMAALFMLRSGAGVHRQRQIGQGREFEKLRDYIPGDALSDIHWKATAKRHRPTTKVHQIERTQEVYLVVDASRLSARPGRLAAAAPRGARSQSHEPGEGVTILDRFLTAALVTCLAAERQGDLFGLIVFSDQVQRFIPARNGRDHYGVCRDAIYNLFPRLVTPDFNELFTVIRTRLRRRALLVFLTNLDDTTLAEAFEAGSDLISRHHLMIVNQLRPGEATELFTSTEVSGMRSLYARLAGHLQWQQLRLLEKAMARRGVRFSLLEHETLISQLVTQYLNIKQRQAL